MTRTLAIASGKGGAGKTSVAVNLAFALARRGLRVCLLDADLGLSNVDVLLGLSPTVTLEHVLFDGAPLRSALTPAGDGVDVIAGSSGVSRMAELSRPARRRLAEQCAGLDGYDYLLVDNSPGISRQVVSLCLACAEALVVVNPEAASVVDAYALIKVLKENGLARAPRLLFNRTDNEAQARMIFERVGQAAAKHLRLPLRYQGQIPRDPAVSAAAARQAPVLTAAPASKAARAFMELAAGLETGTDAPQPTTSTPRPRHGRGAAEFFGQAVARFLETGPAQPAPGPEKTLHNQALAELDQALALLQSMQASTNPPDLAMLEKHLAAARTLLAGDATDRSDTGSPAVTRARNRVLLLGAAPELAEVIEEALGRADLETRRPVRGETLDPSAYQAVVLCRDLRTSAQGPDSLTDVVFSRCGNTPVILADVGLGSAATWREPRAAATVRAPLRLDELVRSVGRLARGGTPGPRPGKREEDASGGRGR